jgi:hypothetical protein
MALGLGNCDPESDSGRSMTLIVRSRRAGRGITAHSWLHGMGGFVVQSRYRSRTRQLSRARIALAVQPPWPFTPPRGVRVAVIIASRDLPELRGVIFTSALGIERSVNLP